jgi:hypothetical protein
MNHGVLMMNGYGCGYGLVLLWVFNEDYLSVVMKIEIENSLPF